MRLDGNAALAVLADVEKAGVRSTVTEVQTIALNLDRPGVLANFHPAAVATVRAVLAERGHPVLGPLGAEDLLLILGFLRVYDPEDERGGQREVLDELKRRDRPLQGARIRLIRTNDPHTELKPGDEGTVMLIDDAGTVSARWDSGSMLGLIPGVDFFEFVEETR